MEAVVALVACALFSYVCAGLIKKAPIAFYIAFILAGALFASGVMEAHAPWLHLALVPYVRRASLAFGLFTVVMMIGALPEDNPVRKRLAPVRGTLSLLGCILIIVHVLGYAATYWGSVANGIASSLISFGFIVGIVVCLLLLVLSVTSVAAVRRALDAHTWKNVQKLAYPFYLLMYVHLAAMLAPSSLAGGNSLANLIVYTVVVVLYLAARALRTAGDRKLKATSQS